MTNADYTVAAVIAGSLRSQVRVALVANGLDHDEHVVAYVAKRMVERENTSLLDEIEKLKRRIRETITDMGDHSR